MKTFVSIACSMLTLVSCGETPAESKKPPFEAKFSDLVLEIPRRADLYQAKLSSFGLSVNICDRHAMEKSVPLCESLSGPLVNQWGVLTFVVQPRSGIQFALLKERPEEMPPPADVPLTVVPASEVNRDIRGPGEGYELSRIRTLDSDQLLTTTNGWPLAACATHPLGNRYCTIGFLIKGAFVEARWFAEAGVALNQAEVWAVASTVDAKLRALSAGGPAR